jgi:hypothetical protein
MADDIYINTGSEFQQPYQGQVIAQGQQPVSRQKAVPSVRNRQSPFTADARNPFTFQNIVEGRAPNIRDARQPFTYQRTGQTPVIYQHPTTYPTQTTVIYNAQEDNSKNNQQPYPYIAAGQEPNIRASQEPNIRGRQNPYPYPASTQTAIPNSNLQQPNSRNRQTSYQYPATYPTIGRQPTTYDHRSPFTYQATGRTPDTYAYRSPYIYEHQQPSPVSYQQPGASGVPIIAQGRQPFTYQTNPAFVPYGGWYPDYSEMEEQSLVLVNQSPFTYNAQQPVRTPIIAQGSFYQAQYQQSYQVQNPYTFQYSGSTSGRFPIQDPEPGSSPMQIPYIFQTQNQPRQAPNPSLAQQPSPYIAFMAGTNQVQTQGQESNIRDRQTPYTYPANGQENNQRNKQVPYPYQASYSATGRQPSTYQHRSPFIGIAYQPNIYQATGRTPDTYNHRSPFTYDHRSPFTYQRTGQDPVIYQQQSPFTYQAQVNFTANRQTTADKQQPYPYTADGQQPFTYQYRSPFTYANPSNAQQPFIAQHRQPHSYQHQYQINYDHRSPFPYQTPYSTTRPIGPLAKVKGVFVNKPGQSTATKVKQVYVHNPNTQGVDLIHQEVPSGQYSKS